VAEEGNDEVDAFTDVGQAKVFVGCVGAAIGIPSPSGDYR